MDREGCCWIFYRVYKKKKKKICTRPRLVWLSAHVPPHEQQPRHRCVISCYRKRNPHPPDEKDHHRSRLRNRVDFTTNIAQWKNTEISGIETCIYLYKCFVRVIYIYFLWFDGFDPTISCHAWNRRLLCGRRSHSSRVAAAAVCQRTSESVFLCLFDTVRLWSRDSIFNIIEIIERKRERD